MILARSIIRILATAAKPAVVAVIVIALAAGLWRYAIGDLVIDSDSPSSGSVARATGPPQLLYSEFGRNEDTLWVTAVDDISQRTSIATVEHAPEYGIFPSLSPDGGHIAYTVLPVSGRASIDAPAEVWLMDSDGSDRRRLAIGADLPITPVWAPDSGSIVFRRSSASDDAAGAFQLVRITLAGSETVLLETNLGLFPVGFSPDGSLLYYVQLSQSGTDLGRVSAAGGSAALIAHLSDDFARDWHLSPDGSRLAFLAPRPTGDRVSFSAAVLELAVGGDRQLKVASAVAGQGQADEFNPIWHPNGRDLTVGRLTAGDGGAPALRIAAAGTGTQKSLAAPPHGFDVPLSWSPDGSYLAVRFFEGDSAMTPGRSWVTVVDGGGERQTVSANSDIEIVGWLDGGG
jgi:Tol biopolymer transport system component